ncbi:MAG TPA: HAD-IIIA family hydrolase [Xanthobacteraceae bacterium]|nr:HAD-IIIA family hydrolase [Xanthobacteraceae bacterium]
MSRAAVFLDRDGVLVEEVFYPQTGEWEAPLVPEDVRLLPGAAAAARHLAQQGFALVLVSNQAAFAKGKTTLRALWLAHERFIALLDAEGVKLDEVCYAFGHPDGVAPHFSGPSLDRKPGPYNLFIAAAKLDLDLGRSWLVGDRETDVDCARAAGLRAIQVDNPRIRPSTTEGVIRAKDLADAVRYIENDNGNAERRECRSVGFA